MIQNIDVLQGYASELVAWEIQARLCVAVAGSVHMAPSEQGKLKVCSTS